MKLGSRETTGWRATISVAMSNYIEAGSIRPLVARTYPLREIVTAQALSFAGLSFTMKWNLLPAASVKNCQ